MDSSNRAVEFQSEIFDAIKGRCYELEKVVAVNRYLARTLSAHRHGPHKQQWQRDLVHRISPCFGPTKTVRSTHETSVTAPDTRRRTSACANRRLHRNAVRRHRSRTRADSDNTRAACCDERRARTCWVKHTRSIQCVGRAFGTKHVRPGASGGTVAIPATPDSAQHTDPENCGAPNT